LGGNYALFEETGLEIDLERPPFSDPYAGYDGRERGANSSTWQTAGRVRGRIEAVLDYARVQGWRNGENPARWRGHMSNLLPARGKVRAIEHHAALDWRDMPGFMTKLRERDTSIGATSA
jgi:hypothetical protein